VSLTFSQTVCLLPVSVAYSITMGPFTLYFQARSFGCVTSPNFQSAFTLVKREARADHHRLVSDTKWTILFFSVGITTQTAPSSRHSLQQGQAEHRTLSSNLALSHTLDWSLSLRYHLSCGTKVVAMISLRCRRRAVWHCVKLRGLRRTLKHFSLPLKTWVTYSM